MIEKWRASFEHIEWIMVGWGLPHQAYITRGIDSLRAKKDIKILRNVLVDVSNYALANNVRSAFAN